MSFVVCLYIPPQLHVYNTIHSTILRLQTQHPETFIAISADFNHVTLDSTLSALY